MKKSKERKDILKQAGGVTFLYILPCLGLAYESYYRNADLRITVRIAGCVILFIAIGAIVSFIKKEYDPRKYNGYMMLFASLGLILQIMLQGGILGEKRVLVCVIGYALAILAGILSDLLAAKKIVVKNKRVREVGKMLLTMGGFLVVFLSRVVRRFSGRRGAVLVELTGGEKNGQTVCMKVQMTGGKSTYGGKKEVLGNYFNCSVCCHSRPYFIWNITWKKQVC